MVIGIVHCPSIAELSATYGEFQRLCKTFPEALTYRCFAFEPSEQQITQDSQALSDMVLFPPGERRCGPGGMACMLDRAVRLQTALARKRMEYLWY